MTFRVALASGVPVSKITPVMTFAIYIDQVNTASGSRSTVAETKATSITVPGTAPTNTTLYILIGAGVFVVLLAILVAILWRRRRHGHKKASAPAAAA
jgi:LPXTG-motif cell wall-anchored protein